MPKLACQSKNLLVVMWMFATTLLLSTVSRAQDTKIWEFSPYEVQVWYRFDPNVPISQQSVDRFQQELIDSLGRSFRSAWRVSMEPVPQNISHDLARNLYALNTKDLLQNDLALIVSTSHAEAKTVRTYQAAAESLTSIRVSAATHAALTAAASRFDLPADSPISMLLSKMQIDPEGDNGIASGFQSEGIAAAFVPRFKAAGIEKSRSVLTPLPWQMDTILNQKDKIFFVNCEMMGDQYSVEVRELDCPMLHFGPVFSSSTLSLSQLPRVTAQAMLKAFAPVARVEAAESTSAELRHKAGGLIVDDNADGEPNPARIRVGDVLLPIIRRDDKNGNPILLQALNFTYCAVTDTDGVKMKANVYTYSGGPGLQGRQNRRTQRVVLRARPISTTGKVQIVVRGDKSKPQPGCFIYTRDFLTNQFDFVGRTDWRGRINIPQPEDQVRVLSDAMRLKRAELQKEALQQLVAKAQAEYEEAAKKAEEAGEKPPNPPSAAPALEAAPIDPSSTVALNQPLLLLYVKSGETALAKLPYVPGLSDVDVVELPDDNLRLQAEAFIRGFQGEILDQIGLRNLLAARIRLLLKDVDKNKDNLDKAAKIVEELRALKNFNEMNDELGMIERAILEQSSTAVPKSARSQIDKMFKTTRDMLQKHLQEDVAATAADQLRKAGGK